MAKRILIVAALVFAALEASAGDFVDEMCKSYKKTDGAQVVTVGRAMLSVAFARADKASKAALKKLNKMTIIALESGTPGLMDKVNADLAAVERQGALFLGETTDSKTGTYCKVYIMKDGEIYTHLLMFFKSDDSSKTGLVDMSGRFLESDLETIGKSANPIE